MYILLQEVNIMRKLIDFINESVETVENGKIYFLNDFHSNGIKCYIRFYDKNLFYTGFITEENEEYDCLQFEVYYDNYKTLTSKTWKGFKSYMKRIGTEVDDKYRFF